MPFILNYRHPTRRTLSELADKMEENPAWDRFFRQVQFRSIVPEEMDPRLWGALQCYKMGFRVRSGQVNTEFLSQYDWDFVRRMRGSIV